MFYTYILQSVPCPDQLYRGHTADLKERLAQHNAGKCRHTSKFLPWKLKFYTAFETIELAQQFEQYLKTDSGHAFARRHLGLQNKLCPNSSDELRSATMGSVNEWVFLKQ